VTTICVVVIVFWTKIVGTTARSETVVTECWVEKAPVERVRVAVKDCVTLARR